jgi:hypothetical protein
MNVFFSFRVRVVFLPVPTGKNTTLTLSIFASFFRSVSRLLFGLCFFAGPHRQKNIYPIPIHIFLIFFLFSFVPRQIYSRRCAEIGLMKTSKINEIPGE